MHPKVHLTKLELEPRTKELLGFSHSLYRNSGPHKLKKQKYPSKYTVVEREIQIFREEALGLCQPPRLIQGGECCNEVFQEGRTGPWVKLFFNGRTDLGGNTENE